MKKLIRMFLYIYMFVAVGTLNVWGGSEKILDREEAIIELVSCIPDIVLPSGEEAEKILSEYNDDDEIVYKEKVAFAVSNNIVTGYEDNTIRPNAFVTRAEYATMLFRSAVFFEKYPVLTETVPNYNDVSDWNKDAVIYVMQRGFMVGYGDSFGTKDYLNLTHIGIINDRIQNGLLSVDKYNFLAICGTSPLNMEKVLASQFDERLAFPVLADGKIDCKGKFGPIPVGEEDENEKRKIQLFFQQLARFDLEDFDYRMYNTPEAIMRTSGKIVSLTRFVPNRSKYFPEENVYSHYWTERGIDNQIVKRSVCVFPSEHCHKEGTHLVQTVGRGYEYFMYKEGKAEGLPEGVEVGKWYRRIVEIEYAYQPNKYVGWVTVLYEEPELLPEEFLTGYTM